MYSAVVQEIVGNGRRMNCTYTQKWTTIDDFSLSNQTTEYYTNGVISSNAYKNATNGFNTSSMTWRSSSASAYLDSLTDGYYGGNKPLETDSADKLQDKFAKIAKGLNDEYCWHMNRYRSALELLTASFASGSSITLDQRNNLLAHTIEMNMRLTALTALVKDVAQQQAAMMNNNNTTINKLNEEISKNTTNLRATREFIENSDSLLTTRKEMIRYTAEKNNHITNQISLWAALNVLAIGTIFAIYRNM